MPVSKPSRIIKILIETQYLPTIAFYSLLYKSDILLIDKHENYHKGSFRNRCEILSSQGRVSLSVPLQSGKNNQLPITEVKINNDENWMLNHLRSIESCYGKAPYFEYYFHIFEETLAYEHASLFDLNLVFIRSFAKIFNLDHKLAFTEHFVKGTDAEIDVKREYISPKVKLRGQILENFTLKPYDQVFSDELDFESNLSILDLVFCLGPEAVLYLKRSLK